MSELQNKPYKWVNYDDGSGHMKTKYGHTFFSYDISTDEIKYPDGRYRSLYDDWKQTAGDYYMNEIYPKESRYVDLLKNGVYAPYFAGREFDRDLEKASYVEVNDTTMMSKDKFMDILSSMRTAEEKNFSDSTISSKKAMSLIRTAFEKSDANLSSFDLEYEHETITVNKDELLPLMSYKTTEEIVRNGVKEVVENHINSNNSKNSDRGRDCSIVDYVSNFVDNEFSL